MNYVILEDEELLREYLQRLIKELRPSWNLVLSSDSVEDAVMYLNHNKSDVDLIFTDVELIDGTCFNIFEDTDIFCPVIFITAYDNYMTQAFKSVSVDYLLKPITKEKLTDTLERFERIKSNFIDKEIKEFSKSKLRQSKNRILIIRGDNYLFYDVSDISYFISEDKYVFAVTKAGKKSLTNYVNLTNVENDVDLNMFFRITRNIIVSINSVKSVSRFFAGRLMVKIADGKGLQEVIVSSARRKAFLNWLNGDS